MGRGKINEIKWRNSEDGGIKTDGWGEKGYENERGDQKKKKHEMEKKKMHEGNRIINHGDIEEPNGNKYKI